MSIPNLITIGRFLLVPLAVYLLLQGSYGGAFAVFVIAGISDGIDGFIARQFHQRTELGAYLDPLADKALLVSIYVVLGYLNHLPHWLVIAVVSRDILIVGGVMLAWIMERPVAMAPLAVSKANTAVQIVLAAVVLAELGLGFSMENLRSLLIILVAGLTVASAAAYVVEWLRHMQNDVPPPGGAGSERE